MSYKRINDNIIEVAVDTSLFSKEVIFKCCYWWGNDYSINLTKSRQLIIARFEKLAGEIDALEFKRFCSKLQTDLLDFQTRSIVAAETENIKNILLVKAFTSLDVYEDRTSMEDIQDPIKFDLD